MDAVFAAPLRGEVAPWPIAWSDPTVVEVATRRILYHGIAGLLSLRRREISEWPELVTAAVRQEALGQGMWELRHRAVLMALFEQLDATGVASLVMKGTALAYTLYPEPSLRRRGDTDILIRRADLPGARTALKGLGFRRIGNTQGSFGDMYYQESWLYDASDGTCHEIDLHWEVMNSRVLAQVLGVDECFARAVPLVRLGPSTRASDPVMQMIQGAINRALHSSLGYGSQGETIFGGNRLGWALDFHLQAAAFTDTDWQQLTDHCCNRGVAAICLDSLNYAKRMLETEIPSDVEQALTAATQETEATLYISRIGSGNPTLADLKATPLWGDRLRLLLARTFPSTHFMRAHYPSLYRWPVAALYLPRLGGAFLQLLRSLVR